MTDHLRAVLDMIGPPENRYADPAAWARLEAELGTELPADYKTIVDAYAPIQINEHLYLVLEYLPMTPGERTRVRRGPDRGM